VVGIELAGEIKCDYPSKKVTLIASTDKLMNRNSTTSDKLRDKLKSKMESMGIELVWNERISLTKEDIELGYHLEPRTYTSNQSKEYKADVGLFSIGNSGYQSSFADTLVKELSLDPQSLYTAEKRIKVARTGQLEADVNKLGHIFALGDISTMDEGTFAYLIPGQASVIANNIAQLVKKSTSKLSEYKGGINASVVTLGRKDGAAQLPMFGVVGGFLVRNIKGKDCFVGKYRKTMNAPNLK
jgi:NADH dehydrogenase FAD-containing subunit